MKDNNSIGLNKQGIAYQYIKSRIMNNEYKCGQIISENKLASTLNMSRTPVREALKILCNENYVDIYKGVGVIVKPLSTKEVYDILGIRLLLESYSIRRIKTVVFPPPLNELLSRWTRLKNRIMKGGDYKTEEILDLDYETHSTTILYSENQTLINFYNDIHAKIRRYQKMFTKITDDDLSAITQHIDILQAIKNKDADKACILLEKHIYTPLNEIVRTDMVALMNETYLMDNDSVNKTV